MTVLTIELIDPSAKVLLEGLVQLNFIKIQDASEPQKRFAALLTKLRSKDEEAPSFEEITAEVEQVRPERHPSND